MKILITGGCGFVGSNLAIFLKKNHPDYQITALDNLKRRGSELNINRLKKLGITYVHGDMRIKDDLNAMAECDLLVDASAEPSVLAGINSASRPVIEHNLTSTLNAIDFCIERGSKFLFLSTSRVYPIATLEAALFEETPTRFNWSDNQPIKGISSQGITEEFPLEGSRSLYGATKLASELFIREYVEFNKLPAIINRCGVISGPWQMGKIDQGVVALWLSAHMLHKNLSYIGYGGLGKQVRDILHIEDLCALIELQLNNWEVGNGQIFNVGGGLSNSLSLLEMTEMANQISGNTIQINSIKENRPADLRIYITDNTKVSRQFGWKPAKNNHNLMESTYQWMQEHKNELRHIFE